MEVLDPQPLLDEIWEAFVHEGFKYLSLANFDGRKDPDKHVFSINTQMTIIKVFDSLKCKLLFGTFKNTTLRWYMVLPWGFIANYQKLVRKLVHYFISIRLRKTSITSLFKIGLGPLESLKDYIARFNESTIKVVPPNQEIFVSSFKNGLKMGHFNESLP